MVMRKVLGSPGERFVRHLDEVERRAVATGTHPGGNKHMEEWEDWTWDRPDGTTHSVRDIDGELIGAVERIQEAEETLLLTDGRLESAEQQVQNAIESLDGKVDDVDLDDPATSARIAGSMTDVTRSLIVTESAILNHATLIGQTVVDDINVQGKLIGTDGVFTGTVDFANVNVTGELLANEISGEYLYGTVVEGGEIRTGSNESRGSFLLGDQAYSNPVDGYVTPGLRFTPPNSTHIYQPAVGIIGDGVSISGGKSATGKHSVLNAYPDSVVMRTVAPEGSTERVESISTGYGVRMRSSLRSGAESATIHTALSYESSGISVPSRAALEVQGDGASSDIAVQGNGIALIRAGGATPRSLLIDTSGVWATEGGTSVSLIPQVRQFQYSGLWNADLSPAHIMVQHLPGGKLCQAQIRIQNLSGSSLSLPTGTWVTLNYNPIPSDLRGGYTDYIDVTLPQNEARGRVEMNYSTGSIRIRNMSGTDIAWTNNNSIWFPMRWFSPD